MDTDIIRHFGRYSIVRSDYVQICDGDVCAAQILHSLEFWTTCRLMEVEQVERRNTEAIKSGMQPAPVPDTWLYEKIQNFIDSICGTFKRTKVIESLKSLKEKGFIESKPSSITRDQTLYYKFNIDKVQQALDKAYKAGIDSRKKGNPQSSDLNSDSSDLNSDSSDLNSDSSDLNSDSSDLNSDSSDLNSDPLYNSISNIQNKNSVCKTRAREENTHAGIEKFEEPETRATERLSFTPIIHLEPVQQIQSLGEDQFSGAGLTKKSTIQQSLTPKYDTALGMRPPAPRVKYLIPDGDWLNEKGQLDPAFINHVAKQWMNSPGATFHKMPIEEVEGKVFSHFAHNHAKLVVAWESYSKVALRHAQGVKQRLDAEISIPESEQQQIVNEGRAIASALSQPEEEKAVPSLPTQEDRKPFGFVLPEATTPEPKAIKSAEPIPEPKPVTQHPSVVDCDWFSATESTQAAILCQDFGFKNIGMAGQVDEPVSDLLIDKHGKWEFYPVLGQPGILEARCQDVVFSGDIGEVDYEVQVSELIAIFKKNEPQPPITENSTAYQPYESEEISPLKQQANLAKLGGLIRSKLKTMPTESKQNVKRAVSSFPSNLTEANQWILDPCLRSQAVVWAKRGGYLIHFTPEGVAFEIEDPEF